MFAAFSLDVPVSLRLGSVLYWYKSRNMKLSVCLTPFNYSKPTYSSFHTNDFQRRRVRFPKHTDFLGCHMRSIEHKCMCPDSCNCMPRKRSPGVRSHRCCV